MIFCEYVSNNLGGGLSDTPKNSCIDNFCEYEQQLGGGPNQNSCIDNFVK
jgi:hypothetical protein